MDEEQTRFNDMLLRVFERRGGVKEAFCDAPSSSLARKLRRRWYTLWERCGSQELEAKTKEQLRISLRGHRVVLEFKPEYFVPLPVNYIGEPANDSTNSRESVTPQSDRLDNPQ